jgi:hypothetical protein
VADFSEGGDDLVIGSTVVEHVVNEVALRFGERGDFAVAPSRWGTRGVGSGECREQNRFG